MSEKIRQVAILVASLDKGVAQQLLSELPRREAAAIRSEMERLDEVDPDEQEQALAKFKLSRQPHLARRETENGSGVEAVFSHRDDETSDDADPKKSDQPPQQETPLARVLAGMEADALAEFLLPEHPQIIAAALSRMGYDQAATVFAALPEQVQRDVLPRVSNLQTVDNEAIEALEAQLVQWTTRQLQQRRQRAAGAELARQILAKTSPQQRALLTGEPVDTPALPQATPLPSGAPALASMRRPPLFKLRRLASFASHAKRVPDAPQTSRLDPDRDHLPKRGAALSDAPAAQADEAASIATSEPCDDRSSELEQLDDARLLYVLQHADEQTVRLALAASSEELWRRIVKRLPRRRAARLRRELFAMGPTKVSDLRRAQDDLLRMALQRAA